MGRQVAGREFLDAYLTHGEWTEVVGLVRNRASAEPLVRLWRTHPSCQTRLRSLKLVEEQRFHGAFLPTPPANLLYLPGPLDPRYTWVRQHSGPGTFALCGITYTMCSAAVLQSLCSLVTAPFESYDTLICASRAAVQMVRSVITTYADYLRDRHGGAPASRVRLEMIPLGVDAVKFHPPTHEERAAQRKLLEIADDEVVVLFVGRLSFHAKAHPFPLFHGVAEAARVTGRRVHLVLSGWAANEAIRNAFRDGVRTFAPGVRVSVVASLKPELRYAIWHAADLFTSLSDNLQETFGLVITQAMACGLPVIASDWNGYRDLVVDGETGYLVPTYMVEDATCDSTARLLMGEINYDHFLAECSQAAVVDSAAAAAAYARLIDDDPMRRRMGAAGRHLVLQRFAWTHVIKAYEALWRDQEFERSAWVARATPSPRAFRGPACYPAPEDSFAGYPTHLLGDEDRLETGCGVESRLERLLAMPLTSYSENRRSSDPAVLRAVLDAATTARVISDLDQVLLRLGVAPAPGRATLAWMLKYGLLQVVTGQGA
jgi:glycosyltransferase involved in cell wall biosynthesis